MKKIISFLVVSLLIGTMAMAQRPSGVIFKTSTTPIIDGQIDDIWAMANQFNIDKKFLLEEPTFGNLGTTYWKALWDDKGIYILVVANDDSWVPWWTPGRVYNWWEYDKPELYFDTNFNLEDGFGGQNGYTGNYQIAPDPKESKIDGTLISFDYHGFNVNYAYKVTDPAWNVEYFIPWNCIPDRDGNLFDKSGTMGFDVSLVDKDLGDGDGRKRGQWANVGAKSEDWNNMDDAGHLTFKNMVDIEGGYPKTYVYNELVQLSTVIKLLNPGTLTYSWSPSEGLSQTDIPNPIVTATTDKTYNLTVTSSNGEIGKASVFIKVNPFVATAKNQTISCGNIAQLDVSTNYTGSGTLTYDWQPKDKLDDATIKNPVATITQATDFTVVVTTPNGTQTQKSIHVDVSKLSFQPELCLVNVDADNHNVLIWKNPAETSIQNYFIFKESVFQTDYYDLIGSVASTAECVYTDLSSNALVQSNKYKIAIKDDCGFISNQSLPHKTMHLTINKGQGNSWNLIWEPYDGFAVSSYKIYRGASVDNLSLIGSTAGSANSYSDFTASEGELYYQIEVLAPFSCSSLKSATLLSSRSNIASNLTNSISSPFNKGAFNIFPVPVHDILTTNMDLSCLSEMVVLAIDGRVEMTFKQPILGNSINVSSLPNGIHILKLANNDGFIIQKFTKE